MAQPLKHDAYTVACICPTDTEMAAVEGMLDEIHPSLPSSRDTTSYSLGRIGQHSIVIGVMPEGTNPAASVATQLLNDFPSVRFGLLVGTGGGVPSITYDIRLGDVVVSKPTDTYGGVIQYDRGKRTTGGQFKRTGSLNKPPSVLLSAMGRLEAKNRREKSKVPIHLRDMLQKWPIMKDEYVYQGADQDELYEVGYDHSGGPTCKTCDKSRLVDRGGPRRNNEPKMFYGTIGSANVVLKDGAEREKLREALGVLCVEMQAASLMDGFPCLVICCIRDYADSHENKQWQPYAAATAAAYMKELLLIIPTTQNKKTDKAADVMGK